MRQRFVAEMPSRRRHLIFESYRWHLVAWGQIVNRRLEQWVNGSFVTAAWEPGDVDFVTFVPASRLAELTEADRTDLDALFMGEKTPAQHLLHAFRVATYPAGHPLRGVEDEARAYWMMAFGTDPQSGDTKGVLSLNVGIQDDDTS
jgi:hypothetical protein